MGHAPTHNHRQAPKVMSNLLKTVSHWVQRLPALRLSRCHWHSKCHCSLNVLGDSLVYTSSVNCLVWLTCNFWDLKFPPNFIIFVISWIIQTTKRETHYADWPFIKWYKILSTYSKPFLLRWRRPGGSLNTFLWKDKIESCSSHQVGWRSAVRSPHFPARLSSLLVLELWFPQYSKKSEAWTQGDDRFVIFYPGEKWATHWWTRSMPGHLSAPACISLWVNGDTGQVEEFTVSHAYMVFWYILFHQQPLG